MKKKTNLFSRLFGRSSSTAVEDQQPQMVNEQSFKVLLFEELPQLQVITQNAQALGKISAEYYRFCYEYIKNFSQNIVELEQQKDSQLKKIEQQYEVEKSKEFYTEKAVYVGGTKCMVRDEDSIQLHYQNLFETKEKEKENLINLYEQKKQNAQKLRIEFQKDIDECCTLEQKLALEKLPYEAIVPTRILKTWIEEMPNLYDFEGKINNGGKFTVCIFPPGKCSDEFNKFWRSVRQIDLGKERGFDKSCFGKSRYLDDEEKGMWYVIHKNEKFSGSKQNYLEQKYGIYFRFYNPNVNTSIGNLAYDVSGKVKFSSPSTKTSEEIVKWSKDYETYMLAEKGSFEICAYAEDTALYHELKEEGNLFTNYNDCFSGGVIPSTNINNMTVLIIQYGESSTLEQQLLTQANIWFQKIHREYFSFE